MAGWDEWEITQNDFTPGDILAGFSLLLYDLVRPDKTGLAKFLLSIVQKKCVDKKLS